MIQPLIKEISFEQILPIWRCELWPKRTSDVEPLSAINSHSDIDMALFNYAKTVFFLAATNPNKQDEILGVISGHQTAPNEYRLRGLYVSATYRGQRISTRLVEALERKILQRECYKIWAMARVANLIYYEKYGFKKILETNKYEYGPHYIVMKNL